MCLWKELCGENNENIRLSYDLKTVELRNGKTDVFIGDFYTGLFLEEIVNYVSRRDLETMFLHVLYLYIYAALLMIVP